MAGGVNEKPMAIFRKYVLKNLILLHNTWSVVVLKDIGAGRHCIEHNPQFSEVTGLPKCFLAIDE